MKRLIAIEFVFQQGNEKEENMLDIKNLTKEQAIEWNKKMWNFIL